VKGKVRAKSPELFWKGLAGLLQEGVGYAKARLSNGVTGWSTRGQGGGKVGYDKRDGVLVSATWFDGKTKGNFQSRLRRSLNSGHFQHGGEDHHQREGEASKT